MTVLQKAAQLGQVSPDYLGKSLQTKTGVDNSSKLNNEELAAIGSVLNVSSRADAFAIQKHHLEEDPNHIPLLFMQDVIHGYKTIYPIPIGLAATFDKDVVRNVSSLAAKEASADGIDVTFSPMADIVRDARWGRVMEAFGEDPTLSATMVTAMVEGYQQTDEAGKIDTEHIVACVKHFAGYGSVEAGREYSQTDFSRLSLFQNYLPPFQAAVNAGVKMLMPAFTNFEGQAAVANRYLLHDVARVTMKFEGPIISDWGSVGKLVPLGLAKGDLDATKKSILAGNDIDMMSGAYPVSLPKLVENGQFSESLLNEAVLRVLNLKNDLGLFEEPYSRLTSSKVSKITSDSRKLARVSAEKSIVVLKNDCALLPLNNETKIGVIGSMAHTRALLGGWPGQGKHEDVVSIFDGLTRVFPNCETVLPEFSIDSSKYQKYDALIVVVGESEADVGESNSRTDLEINASQRYLIHEASITGVPVVVVVLAGRPLVLSSVIDDCTAVLYGWFPGIEGGNAVANIIAGRTIPEGRLPMSFPRTVGQEPLYYNLERSSAPKLSEVSGGLCSRYIDCLNSPLYSFGYGLNYSQVVYQQLTVEREEFSTDETLEVTVKIENVGKLPVIETVQCYIRLSLTTIVRPDIELKHWKKVSILPYTSRKVTFTIAARDLAYVHTDLRNIPDEGTFEVMIGPNASQYLKRSFQYKF